MCGFLPATRLRIDLAELTVMGIQRAEKEKTRIKATMVLQKDLTGTFTGLFTSGDCTSSKRALSVIFCGGQVLPNPTDSNKNSNCAIASLVKSDSAIVLDRFTDDAWTYL